MLNKYDNIRALIGTNPIMQFAKKAAREEAIPLSDSTSPVGISVGLGQELEKRPNMSHLSNVKRHRNFLNMMKFEMQKRS